MVRRAGGARVAAGSPAVSRICRASLSHAMSVTSAALLRACFLLLCLVAGSRQLSIKEFVVPTAVEIGKDAELHCQYDLKEGESKAALYVKWWWTPDSGPSYDRRLIYQHITGHAAEAAHRGNYSQIDVKDNDSITLLDMNPVDSGTYECEVWNIDEIRQHEKLIVYSMGTGPEINYTVINSDSENEEDMLLIECVAEDVAPLPDMSIILQGEKLNISKIVEDTNQDGLYNIYVNATVSAENIEEGEIRCELFYTTLEHQPYVDVETYIPAGRAATSTTELPEDATEPDATHDSLQNLSDDGVRLHYSVLLTFAAVVSSLLSIL